jgi:hypothetical protein
LAARDLAATIFAWLLPRAQKHPILSMVLVDAQGSNLGDLSRVKAALHIEIMRVFSLNASFPGYSRLFHRQNYVAALGYGLISKVSNIEHYVRLRT